MFPILLHPAACGAIITIDIGESCEWPYAGIMDLHSISFCPECQFVRRIFVNYFPLTTAHPCGCAVFFHCRAANYECCEDTIEIKEYKEYQEDEIQALYAAVGWTAYTEDLPALKRLSKFAAHSGGI